jgi:hypothetical protein
MGRDGATIEFTDRDLRLIVGSLPKDVDQRRLGLFPQILQEWGRTDLSRHFRLEPESLEVRQARFKRLTAVQKHAAELWLAIDALDRPDLFAMIQNLACPPERLPWRLTASNVKRSEEELEAAREFLPRLAIAARDAGSPLTPKRGPPRNDVPYLVLLDLAAILEWLTRSEPTRQVDRLGEEAGPLSDLARAVWPVIFGSDYGLSSAIKNWAQARGAFKEKSPLIRNIALRYAAWGVSD